MILRQKIVLPALLVFAVVGAFNPLVRKATPQAQQQKKDFLIWDSEGLKERPSPFTALSTPRDSAALVLVAYGMGVSALNVAGAYGDSYYPNVVAIGALLGMVNAAAGGLEAFDLANGGSLSPDRPGVVNDATVTAYAAAYTLFASWLAARCCGAAPPSIDSVAAPIAVFVFLYSLAAPTATLLRPQNELSPTEILRARGLLTIGFVAVLFVPDCLCFTFGGDDWWSRVIERHPSQSTLESSTSLFAVFATEASMIAHRAGKRGVAPFRIIVPCSVAAIFALAVLPTAANLYWNGAAISFLDFFFD